MNRTPPAEVRKALRQEVGFGCPIPGCANPYLEWHHFAPPWHIREHHDPEGMIALCAEHHKKADAGAFTDDQLRQFKQRGVDPAIEIKGRFDWLRNRLLVHRYGKIDGFHSGQDPCFAPMKFTVPAAGCDVELTIRERLLTITVTVY
ncbi:MAG: hypothetical protein ABI876_02405 [Bacteroidota bacterium]